MWRRSASVGEKSTNAFRIFAAYLNFFFTNQNISCFGFINCLGERNYEYSLHMHIFCIWSWLKCVSGNLFGKLFGTSDWCHIMYIVNDPINRKPSLKNNKHILLNQFPIILYNYDINSWNRITKIRISYESKLAIISEKFGTNTAVFFILSSITNKGKDRTRYN